MISRLLLTTATLVMSPSHAFTTIDKNVKDILPKKDGLNFYADVIRNTDYRHGVEIQIGGPERQSLKFQISTLEDETITIT